LLNKLSFDELCNRLRNIEYRGLYDELGHPLKPYKNAVFKVGVVHPPNSITAQPTLQVGAIEEPLFSPQPTIYKNQSEIIQTVDQFLSNNNMSLTSLTEAVNYNWRGRGDFTILPPIVERHTQKLDNGYLDLSYLNGLLKDKYIKDAAGKLHDLGSRYLQNYHVDEVSKLDKVDIFHEQMPLINFGLRYTGFWHYSIICDGSHRIDHAIEYLKQPQLVIVADDFDSVPLTPYYALPMPFRPTMRLTSKRAEALYPRLERDKFHILNDLMNKTLHYDWTTAGLNVSSLRTKTEIY